MKRKCEECKKTKDESEYYTEKDKLCKKCVIERVRAWQNENPSRKWINDSLKDHRRRGYEITVDKEKLVAMFDSAMKEGCQICDKKLVRGQSKKGVKNGPSKNSPTMDVKHPLKKEIDEINDLHIVCHECNLSKQSRNLKEFYLFCKMVTAKFEVGILTWT